MSTEQDGDLPDGRLAAVEGVGHAGAGADDEGAMDGGPEPGAVGVPPQGALLPGDGEAVGVALARADGALRHVLGPVRPSRPHLPDAVPVHSHVVAAPVDDPDDERVALAHLQRRPRELPVHRHDAVLPAQPSHRRLLDLHAACHSD
jgi:hypothetical protein